MKDVVIAVLFALVLTLSLAIDVRADQDVLATDAIGLAGRTDVVIPPIGGNLSAFPIIRTEPSDPDQALETFPQAIPVMPGEILGFDAVGLAGFSPIGVATGPGGDEPKDVLPVGGISGYKGLGGSLVGVFLDDEIPLANPPAALDFSDAGLGTDFASLAPGLGQIFYIGDGLTDTCNGARQRFAAPAGATRLFLGTMDASGSETTLAGFYTDNRRGFRVRLVPEDIEVLATDAIPLAGRTDVAIPPIGGDLSGFPILRTEPGPGQTPETFPLALPATPGEHARFYAFGSARFSPIGAEIGPDGDVPKDVLPVGGISGYKGPGGSLVGVFLDNEIPLTSPPAALDFTADGYRTDFPSLEPELGQIFYIGDGLTGTCNGARQRFTAPEGTTRLLLGIMDAFGSDTTLPGFYTDNSGSFFVNVVPEPSLGLLSLVSFATLARLRRRRAR